jgi:hypothetical protein
MEYKDCIKKIQEYLIKPPLIILGSGASAPYGLPLMNDLKNLILSSKFINKKNKYSVLIKNFKNMNFEAAIDHTNLSEEQNIKIRELIWDYINTKDFDFFSKFITESFEFPLANLIKIVLRSTPNSVTVVTTNYDRIAEYAADSIGATVVTGFEGSLIREMIIPSSSVINQRVRVRERIVNIWKVHGSLDWFMDKNNDIRKIISYPMTLKLPLNHVPLIIPPGKEKFSFTHLEPFRDIINQADIAFSNANSFFCIGYGFNDEHIQPKLIKQIQSNKPIIVLCHNATEACKRNVILSDVKYYFIIERSSDNRVNVTSSENNGLTTEFNIDLLNLQTFLNTIFGE